MSQPENKIVDILRSSRIPFIREHTYPDLKNGCLRYDFYLPSMNILVEYDGEQHFQRVPKFQRTKSDFTHYQESDRIKNAYALAHHIPFYRIPYWEFQHIHTITDILNPQYLVHSKWHNDQIYHEYLKSID